MKNYLSILIFLCICCKLANAESPTHLAITGIDGSKITYLLLDEPELKFNGANMVIASKAIKAEYQLNTVKQITYENDSNSVIDATISEGITYHIKDNILELTNDLTDFTVHIYDTNGRCLINNKIHKSETFSISLNNFNKGIYILEINNHSYKFIIR